MADKIKCPIHGNELVLEERENLLVAVCKCNVPNNPYKGKIVYQKPIVQKQETSFEKSVSPKGVK